MTTFHSSGWPIGLAIAGITTFFGYILYRGLRYGEYKRIGRSGKFHKADDPGDYWGYMLVYAVEFGCCLFVLILTLVR